MNASEHDAVIFAGSGSTAAVHKLIHALGLKTPPVRIFALMKHFLVKGLMKHRSHISIVKLHNVDCYKKKLQLRTIYIHRGYWLNEFF